MARSGALIVRRRPPDPTLASLGPSILQVFARHLKSRSRRDTGTRFTIAIAAMRQAVEDLILMPFRRPYW
jgi:hypothetical protein